MFLLSNPSSCLTGPLDARMKRTPVSTDRRSGAHLPDNWMPTIFCQFSEMIFYGVVDSPMPQSSHAFSTISAKLLGIFDFMGSSV